MAKTKKKTKPVGRPSSTSVSTSGNLAGDMHLCQPIVGLSKLKSQLRQANRLLQKDGLNSELRQRTQLKVTQLEDAIENNPNKEKERRNAIKYHRIKFFERKKVTRRLKSALSELHRLDSSEKQFEAKKQKLELKIQLLRIDLNYVRHYPKHLKYVALFPDGESKNHEFVKTPLPEKVPSSKEPDLLRNYVRIYISQSMESGLLSNTPETVDFQEVDDQNDQLIPSKPSLENDEFFEPDMD